MDGLGGETELSLSLESIMKLLIGLFLVASISMIAIFLMVQVQRVIHHYRRAAAPRQWTLAAVPTHPEQR